MTATASREPIGVVKVQPYGKYFLVRKLAEGGMAEIFLAKQVGVEGFEKNVVIKRMLPHLSASPDFVNMFLDEARLATRLAHPNIVQINDLGHADGCHFICMEYLPGEDFSTCIRVSARRGQHVPLPIALKVIAEAARGLQYAHEFTDAAGNPLNVVHRDVSPSNIFVTYTGQVKVLDFGIARAESRVTQTTAGVVKGKYQYMSPEQAEGGVVDRRADIYSLGVSLYEALTNHRPFAHDTDLAILNAVLKNDYKRPRAVRPDLPEELERIVVKALAPRVEDRYQWASELAADLEKYMAQYTTGSGGAGVSTYMASFFGPDRLKSKTRIESLAELSKQSGTKVQLPGEISGPFPALSSSGDTATRAVPLPPGVEVPAKKPAGSRALLLAGAGIGLLVAAVAFVAMKVMTPAVPIIEVPPAVVVDAGVPAAVTPPPVVDPLPVPAVDAGAVVEPPVADAGAPVEVKPPPVHANRPVKLTTNAVVAVVKRSKAQAQRCFDQHKRDLPADSGQLQVTFSILGSGRVGSAKSGMADKQVGRCIEGVVKAMRFPAHVDGELQLTLPFEYQVKR